MTELADTLPARDSHAFSRNRPRSDDSDWGGLQPARFNQRLTRRLFYSGRAMQLRKFWNHMNGHRCVGRTEVERRCQAEASGLTKRLYVARAKLGVGNPIRENLASNYSVHTDTQPTQVIGPSYARIWYDAFKTPLASAENRGCRPPRGLRQVRH